MKNKKLLTRIFALLASLVLVVALAVPCFADTVSQQPDISKAVHVDSLDDMLTLMNDVNVRYHYYPVDIFIQDFSEDYFTGTIFIGEDIIEIYASDVRASSTELTVTNLFVSGNPNFDIGYERSVYYSFSDDGEYYYVDDAFSLINNMVIYDVYTEAPPTDSGWYGEIKNIIKDAIFGQNASLDDSQRFTINQISLWLTIITVLLPLIVVGVILVRCFR